MSIRGRLDRIDHQLGGEDTCRYCNGQHVRTWVDLLLATRGADEPVAVCECDMCQVCAWLRELKEDVRQRYGGPNQWQ